MSSRQADHSRNLGGTDAEQATPGTAKVRKTDKIRRSKRPLPSTSSFGPIKPAVLGMFRAVCEVRPSVAIVPSMTELVALINERRIMDGRAYGLMYLPNLSSILRNANPSHDAMIEILRAMTVDEVGIDPKHLQYTEDKAYFWTRESLLAAKNDKWFIRNKPGLLVLNLEPCKFLVGDDVGRQQVDGSADDDVPEHFGPASATISVTVTPPKPGCHVMLFRDHNFRLVGLNEKFGIPDGVIGKASGTQSAPVRDIAGSATDFRVIALAQPAPFPKAFPRDDQYHSAIGRPKWSALMRTGDILSDVVRIVVVRQ